MDHAIEKLQEEIEREEMMIAANENAILIYSERLEHEKLSIVEHQIRITELKRAVDTLKKT